ncbi:hypothetical protein [Melghirimyces algeriensis]|uniref:Uncharacterized protein n=1 Tax=Melghirimyces algeriensis TaxID=910412 RepID=A0A521CU83_9BACL|nr:hypothetical protein [Melghirimyces algeriensis]SMO62291.1 hypothetical protein SAMN06264849_104155 [Melghirimyces algeriensis]
MASSGPTKKDFADLINQMMGQNVVNSQLLDQVLKEAKKGYHQQGLEGFFEYIRNLTNIPLSNTELKQLMDIVIGAGTPDQALNHLVNQKWISKDKAETIERKIGSQGKR